MISHETFNLLSIVWIAVAVFTFPFLLKIPQPYGRHVKKDWGPMINNRAGWFLMELPALMVFSYFLSLKADFSNAIVAVAALLWVMHYFNRVFIFPFQLRTKGKKMPLIIVFMAIFFNTVNGFLNGYWLSHFVNEFQPVIVKNLHLVPGIILFISGFAINKYHDRLLIRLRSSGPGYSIPFGGLFKFVSCPNFLGEIITWAGFFLVTLSLPALSFLVWTSVNLIARALDHHKWYKSEFPTYPENRKAIIPMVI